MIIAFAALFCSCSQKTLPPGSVSTEKFQNIEADYELPLISGRSESAENLVFPDKMPDFSGKGHEYFARWIHDKLDYPVEARNAWITGKVRFSFVVDIDGSVKDIRIENSAHELLSKEIIRVISLSPKWTPAENGGKKVRVRFFLPIDFNLSYVR